MENMKELPRGWVSVKINEVGELLRGVSYKKEDSINTPEDNFLPVLRANNINGELNFDDLVYVRKKYIEEKQLIKEDDIIFAMSSGSKHLVGKSARAKCNYSGSFGAFCSLFRTCEQINKKLLSYFFQGPRYKRLISVIAKGTNINNLKREHILDLDYPLASIEEQHRIVAKIEELFSELDKGVESLKTSQQQLKVYRQAVLKWAFEGKLTEEWRNLKNIKDESHWITLNQVCNVTGGITKNSKRNDLSIKMPYLRVANVYSNRLELDEIESIGVTEKEKERTLLKEGDLLFVEGNGSVEQIGRVALWNGQIKNCLHQNHLIKVRPCNDIESKYILYFYISLEGRNLIKKEASSTSGLYTISISKIGQLGLPLREKAEQAQIVQEIESRLSVCDKMEESIEKSMAQAEALRQSILKKAFEGKLVPQDPNDEPAEKLLERIRAEKQKGRKEL